MLFYSINFATRNQYHDYERAFQNTLRSANING